MVNTTSCGGHPGGGVGIVPPGTRPAPHRAMSRKSKSADGKVEARRAHRERGLHKPPEEMTALERHCAFFDRNGDGYITPKETYQGCRALGYGRAISAGLAVTIHAGLGWVTARPPRPTSRVRLDRVHRGKHGSDSGIYDEEGRFNEERFARLFDRYDRDGDGALDKRELITHWRADRNAYDPVGQVAAFFEFVLTYMIAAEGGKITKETLRALYDGSLFYEIEARRAGSTL
jgi:peroxygenase